MDIAIWICAAIGALCVLRFVIAPLVWISLYATGATIFYVRTAGEVWRAKQWYAKAADVLDAWWRKWKEGATWPASQIRHNDKSWKPLFKYSGFEAAKRRKGEP